MQNKIEKVEIDKKVFYRTMWALVVPMALQNLINVGVQSADVVMLGKVGEKALSGAALAGQLQFVMMLIFFGLASGASVLTAQYWGKGDTRTIEKVTAFTLKLSVLVSLIFFFLALFMPEQVMRIFTVDEELVFEGASYLRVVAPSYLFMAFTNVYLNILRSVEKVVVSTVVYLISFVTNVIVNSIFIFGLLGAPRMGTAGAALGTTISRLVELVIVLVIALRNPILRLRAKDFISSDPILIKDFFKYATPTILNELFWGLAISTNSVIIGRLGAEAVAANSVANVVRQLAMVISFGIANAAAVMIGKAIGSGEEKKAMAYASLVTKLTFIIAAGGSAVILIIRPFVIGALDLSPLAQQYLSFLLYSMSWYVIGQAYTATMVVGVFRGGGDPKFGLVMDVCVMWLGTLPMGALAAFVFHWPVELVFLVLMADEVIKFPLVTWRYKSRKWIKNVTR